MRWKLFGFLVIGLCLIGLASAGSFGIDSSNLPRLLPEETTGTTINESILNVNNSQFLENHPASYFYPYSNPNGYYNSTSFPDNYLLNTGDTATGSYTFDTSTLRIDSTNHRVGIGTTSPSYSLDVNGNLNAKGISGGYSATAPNTSNVFTNIWIPRSPDIGNFIFLDWMDEANYWDKKYNNLTISTAPSSGTTNSLFRDDTSTIVYSAGTSPYPLVIEIDSTTKPIYASGNGNFQIGLTFRSSGADINPTNITIEFWNTTLNAYEVAYQNQTFITTGYAYWLSPRLVSKETSSKISKLKITFDGTNPVSNSFRIQRLSLYHATAELDPWHLHVKGGSIYGNVTMEESLVVNKSLNVNNTLYVKSGNQNVGIGTANPTSKLEVNGSIIASNGNISSTGYFNSTIATGTAPYKCTSTTLNTNLNADLWDGYQFSDYLDQAVKTTSSPNFTKLEVGTTTIYNLLTLAGTGMLQLTANTTSMVCNSTNAGGIYYDGTTYTHYGCNSTDWRALY